eukprot:1920531-Rhodomonas_salina.1
MSNFRHIQNESGGSKKFGLSARNARVCPCYLCAADSVCASGTTGAHRTQVMMGACSHFKKTPEIAPAHANSEPKET